MPDPDAESWDITLAAKPTVFFLALGSPVELVPAAHDAGSLVIQQVMTVDQAIEAAGVGVDVIIAQGGESGGFGETISSLPLILRSSTPLTPSRSWQRVVSLIDEVSRRH